MLAKNTIFFLLYWYISTTLALDVFIVYSIMQFITSKGYEWVLSSITVS